MRPTKPALQAFVKGGSGTGGAYNHQVWKEIIITCWCSGWEDEAVSRSKSRRWQTPKILSWSDSHRSTWEVVAITGFYPTLGSQKPNRTGDSILLQRSFFHICKYCTFICESYKNYYIKWIWLKINYNLRGVMTEGNGFLLEAREKWGIVCRNSKGLDIIMMHHLTTYWQNQPALPMWTGHLQ